MWIEPRATEECLLSFVGRGFSRDIRHRNREGLQPLNCPE